MGRARRRPALRFLLFLMIALLLVIPVPVPAAGISPDPRELIMGWVNATDPANATLILNALEGRDRHHRPATVTVYAGPAAPSYFSIEAAGPVGIDGIGPGDSLQAAIDAAPDGSTIDLDPGIYQVHDITIAKNIRIRSNASAGGTRSNTILDAEQLDRIFNVTGPFAVAIDNLTLRNGTVTRTNTSEYKDGDTYAMGGAILAVPGSTLSITSADFRNFTVTSADFNTTDNHAYGGAIAAEGGTVTIVSSSFQDCTAHVTGVTYGYAWGGAIYVPEGSVTITSSTFSRCSVMADHGYFAFLYGGAVGSAGSLTTITTSTFTDCTATTSTTVMGNPFGGAVYSGEAASFITDSAFTGCMATGTLGRLVSLAYGGAVYSGPGTTITSVTFTDCTAGSDASTIGGSVGGAVYSGAGTSISRSSFTGCTATGTGLQAGEGGAGAVYSGAGTTISGSSFTGCTATGTGLEWGESGAGAVYSGDGTTITDSTFTGCTGTASSQHIAAGYSGAVYSGDGTTITNSTFTRCTASGTAPEVTFIVGGAVFANGETSISRSSFTGCSVTTTASGNGTAFGGAVAIVSGPGETGITGTTFSDCSAFASAPFTGISEGGAIAFNPLLLSGSSGTLSVTSSTITGCSAGNGGAVSMGDGTGAIHFNRLYQNTAGGTGPAINATGNTDATHNWWGSNSDPAPLVWGPVTTDPWLVLGITSTPSSINAAQIPAIRANLISDSAGASTAGGGIFVPANIMSSFAVVTGYGSVSPPAAGTANGIAGTWFRPAGTGATNISATIDDQTVYLNLTVLPAPPAAPVATLDTSGNDDGFPSAAVTPATAQADTIPLMTVTVNIGGDSKAWQAIVTGTGLRDLIVTGTLQSGSGSNMTAPPGIVYQYISLVPARYTSITKSVINFTVPQSWLDENHIEPKSIVLYHQTANGWVALPTTMLFTKDGTVYFSAESTGFSLFAIAGTPTALTPATIATMQEIKSAVVQTPAPAAVAKAPVTTQTTVPPATTPQPSASSPLLNIVLVIAAIGVLAGGGFLARRWWIRRQNPALFEEYD
jgi:hypothetical protein